MVWKKWYFGLLCLAIQALVAVEASAANVRERLIAQKNVADGARQFRLMELFNQNGEYEVRVFLKEQRMLGASTERLLLIGRAINVPQPLSQELDRVQRLNPRRVTTWFIPTAVEILQPIEYQQLQDDPWPTARAVIRNNISTDNQWYAWVVFENVATTISLACSNSKNFFENIKKEQLELLDLEIRIKHLQMMNPDDPTIPIAQEIIAANWKSIADRIHNTKTRDTWLYVAGDVALTVIGAKLVTAAAHGAGVAARAFSQSATAKMIEEAYAKLAQGVRNRATSALNAVSTRILGTTSRLGTRYALARLTLQQQVSTTVSYLQTKSVLSRLAVNSIVGVAQVVRTGIANTKYVGLAIGMQVAAETLARPEDLFDPNPLVMTRKMAGDQDFVQNVAYMTNETFWMAGVAMHFASSLKKRIAICATIGLVNSTAMSLLIQGETDTRRIATDTAWEAVVGNLQTQVDTTSLRYFEGLTERLGNSKLKFVGYAVAIVDQGAGYYAYAKITHFLQKQATSEDIQMIHPEIRLIPIMSESEMPQPSRG